MLTKRQEYYIKQFNKIDRKELSWNWAAFFCCPLWSLYRKSYLGMLKSLVTLVVLLIIAFVQPFVAIETAYAIAILLWLLVCGLCGNRWYYSTVKHRIAHGYHLCKNYKPTNSFLIYFAILGTFVDAVLNMPLFGVLGYLLPFIYWYKDKRSARKAMNGKTITDAELNVENIAKLI